MGMYYEAKLIYGVPVPADDGYALEMALRGCPYRGVRYASVDNLWADSEPTYYLLTTYRVVEGTGHAKLVELDEMDTDAELARMALESALEHTGLHPDGPIGWYLGASLT